MSLQIYFLSDSNNVYGASEGMSVLPSFCINALKLLFYVRQMKIIRELMCDMKENVRVQCQKSPTSAEIFTAAEKHLSILTILFMMSLISCIIFYCAIPYAMTMYKIYTGAPYEFVTPLSVQFPFSIAHHPIYEIIFFMCCCSVFFMAMEMISMDTVFVGLVIFSRAHFTDLIGFIKRSADHDSGDERAIEKGIRDCIAYHKQAMGYVERVQQAMSATIFVQYLGSTLLLCMIIFQTKIATRVDNIPVYVSFLSGCITQLFMYSFYGTHLTEEGLRVADVIYQDFDWYEYSPRNRKLLLLFLLRAQKPLKLTALKIFDCSLSTFMMVRIGAVFVDHFSVLIIGFDLITDLQNVNVGFDSAAKFHYLNMHSTINKEPPTQV